MRSKFVFEAIEDVLKPKPGALEKLKKLTFHDFMKNDVGAKTDGWIEMEYNLKKALEYKGYNDLKNIVGFDYDTTAENFPGNFEDFIDVGFEKEYSLPPSYRGGLTVDVGTAYDGSKIIYFHGGSVDGYIARKEWLI